MKKILVPSDLSDISENALKMAVDLAERTGAEIFLINFTSHPAGASFTATGEIDKKYAVEDNVYTVNLVGKYQEQLSELAGKYSSASVPINYQVYDEDLKGGVVKFISDNDIDLIVMGTSGEESADEFFTGNHTQQVIEVATCPVISIRNNYRQSGYGQIVLGLSLERDRYDNFLQAANYMNDLALSLNAEVEVVNVVEPGSDNRNALEMELRDLLGKCGLKSDSLFIIEDEDKEKGLLNFAREHSAAFLAVLTHADDNFFRIFRSSLSEDLSMNSDIPVITINLHNI